MLGLIIEYLLQEGLLTIRTDIWKIFEEKAL